MHIYIFGGHSNNEALKENFKMYKDIFLSSDANQILLVPYSLEYYSGEFLMEWYKNWTQLVEELKDKDFKILNAGNVNDLDRVERPFVYIPGSSNSEKLLHKIQENTRLIEIIKRTKFVLADDESVSILGKKLVQSPTNSEEAIGLLDKFLITQNTDESDRINNLENVMKSDQIEYLIQIEKDTGIVIENILKTHYQYDEKFGKGLVLIKKMTGDRIETVQ